jgi:hypothetical protein
LRQLTIAVLIGLQPTEEDMMAANQSNEDLVSGRVNRANSTTEIWALKRADENFGPSLFSARVNAGSVAENPDGPLIGIHGAGWASNAIEGRWGQGNKTLATERGIGVRGDGCAERGTGVMGIGGGSIDSSGQGGIGVQGIGGTDNSGNVSGSTENAGLGVLGMGGARSANHNIHHLPHGAGVAGYGGSYSRSEPEDYYKNLKLINKIAYRFQGPGVLGVGSSMEQHTRSDGAVVGPSYPAAGVVGIGGIDLSDPPSRSFPQLIASGIIGFSSSLSSALSHESTQDLTGAGVYGFSDEGRGGTFATNYSGQVRLSPAKTDKTLVFKLSPSPREVESEGGLELPYEGLQGDMFAMSDNNGQCALWFCTTASGTEMGAIWAPIVFGKAVIGSKKKS